MDVSLFIQGIIIGLTLAVPVGPIALMCIHRTVIEGRLHGIFSGLGVATADSCYAAISVLGLTFISGVIVSHQYPFRFLAAVVLIIIGIQVFMAAPRCICPETEHETFLKDYLSMVAIAIANPLTLVFFLVLLPGIGVFVQGNSFFSALEFVAGVFLGSAAWWIILCGFIGSVRSRISQERFGLINRVSGLLISCFGAGMLILLITTIIPIL